MHIIDLQSFCSRLGEFEKKLHNSSSSIPGRNFSHTINHASIIIPRNIRFIVELMSPGFILQIDRYLLLHIFKNLKCAYNVYNCFVVYGRFLRRPALTHFRIGHMIKKINYMGVCGNGSRNEINNLKNE